MSDFEIDADEAMRQAGMSADDYLSKAYQILNEEYQDWTVRDAIELAKIMANDFHTSMMCLKMQEIRNSLTKICHSLNKEDE